jgi:hypothetical protein
VQASSRCHAFSSTCQSCKSGIFALQTASFVWYTLIVSVSSESCSKLKVRATRKAPHEKRKTEPIANDAEPESHDVAVDRHGGMK